MSEPDAFQPAAVTPVAAPVAVADPSVPIVAKAGRYYRNARFVMVLGLIVMGAYFLYDGYKGYPAKNARIKAVADEIAKTPPESERWIVLDRLRSDLKTPHSDTDIALQKVLGFVLPIGALVYMTIFIRKSRGEIRLENDTLTVPGHPPVPLAAVKSVDSRLWKKKGIAVVKYDISGRGGAITLDDFVYQQAPIDAIYDRLIAQTSPPPPSDA